MNVFRYLRQDETLLYVDETRGEQPFDSLETWERARIAVSILLLRSASAVHSFSYDHVMLVFYNGWYYFAVQDGTISELSDTEYNATMETLQVREVSGSSSPALNGSDSEDSTVAIKTVKPLYPGLDDVAQGRQLSVCPACQRPLESTSS